jgi:hypothetical protein
MNDMEDKFCDETLRARVAELGHWLVQQGKRIGKSYTSKGAPRAVKTTQA